VVELLTNDAAAISRNEGPRAAEDILLEERSITQEALDEARQTATRTGRTLIRVLIDDEILPEEVTMKAVADSLGLPLVALQERPLDHAAALAVPEALARRSIAVGIEYDEDGTLVVATSDPRNPFIRDDIRAITGSPVRVVVATRSDILGVLARISAQDIDPDAVAALAVEDDTSSEEAAFDVGGDDAPMVRLLNLVITQGVDERASDIHIEPQEDIVRVRYRIDGVLHEQMKVPRQLHAGLLSRLKVMADLDIADRRIPQDGRVGLVIGGRAVDLRVATLPTVYGEKAVIRILDKSRGVIGIEDLGFADHTMKAWQASYERPHGMLLSTGPTGSGKSTTLYATLRVLNESSRNIITVEDPVEYRLAGVNQVQVHTKAGLTFASALRSILRADPDIVLIGEIRDAETARIAVQAALTGHLVLSTLHTNDAPSAVTRLIDMGIEPFLVASALDCAMAQRLVRVLCEKCREEYKPDADEMQILGLTKSQKIFRRVGCQACSQTGYRGRQAIYEVMSMNEEIRHLANERASSDHIARVALDGGMTTLRDDAVRLVKMGRTSIEELRRVIA
jgi:type IV pilus assembly protein PilB